MAYFKVKISVTNITQCTRSFVLYKTNKVYFYLFTSVKKLFKGIVYET